MSNDAKPKDDTNKPPPEHTINGAFTVKGEDAAKVYALMARILEAINTNATADGCRVDSVRVDFAHHGDRTSRLNP